MARIGVLYNQDIKERVFGVFATNDSTGGYVLTLTASPTSITKGQSSTITATLTNKGKAVQGKEVTFRIGSTIVGTGTTDTYGQATYTYQGTVAGTIQISASSSNVRTIISMTISSILTVECSGEQMTLSKFSGKWLDTDGDVVIDWGDGHTTTVNNPTTPIIYNYEDGESSHNIRFIGKVVGMNTDCFRESPITSVSIPNTVTTIGNSCFDECDTLTSVTIPNTVTTIGYNCFYGCDNLTSVTLPNNITSLGDNFFRGCRKLTSLSIPNNITTLGSYCFSGCTTMTSITIPNGVTSLGNGCFYNCMALTSITIPSTVTTIGASCFGYCDKVNYQLYWTGNNIITYDSSKMPIYSRVTFTIPNGQTANYVAKGYPSDKLVERS